MKITQSYGVKFKDGYDAVKRTTVIFNDAIAYLLTPIQEHWIEISKIPTSNARMNFVDRLVRGTRYNQALYDFDEKFYKLPSYLRRAAITKAIGAYSSYASQLKNWNQNGCIGSQSKLDVGHHLTPSLYKGNMFKVEDGVCLIKVYRNHDWVWQKIRLNQSDLKYLEKKAPLNKWESPVLEKRYGHYELRFSRKIDVVLSEKEIFEQKVCAVDNMK